MKTLNEVIQALDSCMPDCDECFFYCEGDGCVLSDAPRYLKEYRNREEFYKLSIQRCIDLQYKLEKTIAEYLSMNNPSLTWMELCEMEGKPVYWMHGEVGEWLTIYSVPTLGNKQTCIYATTCSGHEVWIYSRDLDKYQYYRKERK